MYKIQNQTYLPSSAQQAIGLAQGKQKGYGALIIEDKNPFQEGASKAKDIFSSAWDGAKNAGNYWNNWTNL